MNEIDDEAWSNKVVFSLSAKSPKEERYKRENLRYHLSCYRNEEFYIGKYEMKLLTTLKNKNFMNDIDTKALNEIDDESLSDKVVLSLSANSLKKERFKREKLRHHLFRHRNEDLYIEEDELKSTTISSPMKSKKMMNGETLSNKMNISLRGALSVGNRVHVPYYQTLDLQISKTFNHPERRQNLKDFLFLSLPLILVFIVFKRKLLGSLRCRSL